MTGETKAAYFEEVAPAASTGIALTHFLNIEIRILSICFIAWIISHLEMFGDYYNFLLVGMKEPSYEQCDKILATFRESFPNDCLVVMNATPLTKFVGAKLLDY